MRHERPSSWVMNVFGHGRGLRLAVALFSLAALFAAGCNKKRANMSLNKAKKLMTEAEVHEAPRIEAQEYENLKGQIEEADRLMAEGNFKRALEQSGRAVDSAKRVVESTKSKLAAQRLNEAKEWLDVADRNHGVQENAERYNKVKDLYNKANDYYNKNKWDNAIKTSNEEIQEVQTLLARLLNEAVQRQQMAQARFDEMKTAGAETFASRYVIDVQGMLQAIENKINVERDYLGARNQADEAIRKSEEGINATKGKMAQEEITQIEDKLADSQNKGASIYAKDMLQSCNEAFDNILQDYYQQRYDKVLESTKILAPRVDKLLFVTRQESARARMDAVKEEIAFLEEGGARQYLPGSLEKIESMLQEADGHFKENLFDETESKCEDAMREGNKTRNAFNGLALDAMREAAESLEIARNVFSRMNDIFIIRPDQALAGPDLQFEQAKQAMKSELENTLNNSKLTLSIAKLNQDSGQYRKSIELAGEVKRSADYVLNETYHIVAHNAIMEMASQITQREADGAREYVPAELERTRNLLESARQTMNSGDFKEAVRKTSEARAQLELTTQELAQKAIGNIKSAKEKIAEAPIYHTEEYQKSELERARQLLGEAEAALESLNLKPAVEIALEAANVASKASETSARTWCEQSIESARAAIERAEQAGAMNYAGEHMDEARRFFDSAGMLHESGNYLEGKNVAIRAEEKAIEAFYLNVTAAETAINQAKSYNAWKYRHKDIADAIVNARVARNALDRGDYTFSADYASRARNQAEAALKASQKMAFKERLSGILEGMDTAMKSGANYFQASDTKTLYAQLTEIQQRFDPENFDQTASEMDRLDADVERLVSTTPEVLNVIITQQSARLDQQMQTRAAEFASETLKMVADKLKYARMDFDNKRYSNSYRELQGAIEQLDEVENKLDLDRYSVQMGQILDDLNDAIYKFRHVLELGPDAIERFTEGPAGKGQYITIAGQLKPYEFRAIVSDLLLKAGNLDVPAGAGEIQDAFIEVLSDIHLASADFEKLVILDEFTPAARVDIIRRAFRIMTQANKKRSDLQNAFYRREWGISAMEGKYLTKAQARRAAE